MDFFLRVRGNPNDEIDHKKKYVLRFYFLIWSLKIWIWAFLLPLSWQSALSCPNDTAKFPNFFLRVRGDLSNEIDYKRKICSTIRFFNMISQSVNLSLFVIYKLIKRPLPSKQQGGNFLNFSLGLEETLMMRLITKEIYVLRFDFLIWSLKIWIWMSVFWLCFFFLDIRNFCYYARNRPLPSKRHGEISWISPQG